MKRLFILSATFLCLLNNCSNIALRNSDDNSMIICRLALWSNVKAGFGCEYTIKNIETNELYKSKVLEPFGEMAYIFNVPKGQYEIISFKLPTGQFPLRIHDQILSNECPILNIDKAGIYFLGSYHAKYVGHIIGQEIYMKKVDDNSVNMIRKKIENNKSKWDKCKIHDTQSVFRLDSLRVM